MATALASSSEFQNSSEDALLGIIRERGHEPLDFPFEDSGLKPIKHNVAIGIEESQTYITLVIESWPISFKQGYVYRFLFNASLILQVEVTYGHGDVAGIGYAVSDFLLRQHIERILK